MTLSEKTSTKKLLESIASQLSRVEHFDGFSYISTPLLFPSGGSVVVRVQKSASGDFVVTDYGLAYDECDLINGRYYFSRFAPKCANDYGIEFDQHSFFCIEVSESQLAGSIVAVANCVLETVSRVFARVEEFKAQLASDKLYERLSGIFGPSEIHRDFQIRGASNHEWRFDSMLNLNSKIVLFEAVSKNHNSVFSAVAKFHDIARIDAPPTRVSVIGKQKAYGDYLSLLSQASNVIEREASKDTYTKLAAVA